MRDGVEGLIRQGAEEPGHIRVVVEYNPATGYFHIHSSPNDSDAALLALVRGLMWTARGFVLAGVGPIRPPKGGRHT